MAIRQDDVALIAVMGPTGCGKSTFVNTASGSESQVVGSSLVSCTASIGESIPFDVTLGNQPKRVVLIDTPGFDDTSKSDIEILKLVAQHLERKYKNEIKLAGVVYMQRISDPRMGGTFTRNARMFRKLCGHTSMVNVVIATTFWSRVTPEEGKTRESDLGMDIFFGRALKLGAKMMRHDRQKNSALEIIQHILENEPLALRIQKQMVDKQKQLAKTDASQELYRVLTAQLKQFEKELNDLDEELIEAQKAGNSDDVEEIENEKQNLERQTSQKKSDRKTIHTGFWRKFRGSS